MEKVVDFVAFCEISTTHSATLRRDRFIVTCQECPVTEPAWIVDSYERARDTAQNHFDRHHA